MSWPDLRTEREKAADKRLGELQYAGHGDRHVDATVNFAIGLDSTMRTSGESLERIHARVHQLWKRFGGQWKFNSRPPYPMIWRDGEWLPKEG